MAPLTLFTLPLPPDAPPKGYGWENRTASELSCTTAFVTGLDDRDKFLGKCRCVVCGEDDDAALEHCHIIHQSGPSTWGDLKTRKWIPSQAKDHPTHESRNGLIMCKNHHGMFDAYKFFIRFDIDTQKYILISYSGAASLEQYHGKSIALDIQHHKAPFPSLFIIHEMRVPGFHPFRSTPDMPTSVQWQDWITSSGVLNSSGSTTLFRRDRPDSGNDNDNYNSPPQFQQQPQPQSQSQTTPSGTGHAPLASLNDSIYGILAATRSMPSWKACQMENSSWAGTADENIQKYITLIGEQSNVESVG
ncbi:hypothetical protein VNI00_010600 [Paramarasmius palmivorus]|uniref:HNH nuclease domain-containing protein n=1 Tax=Paramarasmius palmivorus TaxID=297713 RepID=A0AAW0CJ36_9AGAR